MVISKPFTFLLQIHWTSKSHEISYLSPSNWNNENTMKLETQNQTTPCNSPLKLLSSPKKRQSKNFKPFTKRQSAPPLRAFQKNKILMRPNRTYYKHEIELFLKKKHPDLLIIMQQGKLLLDNAEDEHLYNL